MKKFVRQIIAGKDLRINAALILAIFVLVGLGCMGGSKNTTPVPSSYYGAWTGSDGSTLTIRSDNSGDFHSGNFKVENGTVAIDDAKKELSVTFVGIGKTLKIDKEPNGNQMTLGGVTYSKGGGTTTTLSDSSNTSSASNSTSNTNSASTNPFGDKSDNSSKTTSTAASGDVPPDSELQSLTQKSIQDFADAVESEDFSDFRETTSSAFQAQYTADSMKTAFDVFIKQKDKVVPVLRSTVGKTAAYSPAPTYSGGVLNLNGTFNAKQLVTFELKYVKEGGDWKVQWIRVKL